MVESVNLMNSVMMQTVGIILQNTRLNKRMAKATLLSAPAQA
jgi:hypothetical protein